MWVMGEWAVGHWIVGIMSFQKIYGLYGLKHNHIVYLREEVNMRDGETNEQTIKVIYGSSASGLLEGKFCHFKKSDIL